MPTGEILTQKGDEDLRTLPKPSLQFGVVTTNDSTKSGDGSSYPGTAGLQLPISWISRWKRQMYPDKLMGESLGERNKRDDRSERADL